ncbi:hypothetical protein HS125_20550 [bacterium]|nr:hypothetical protein [bacterium]
MPGARGAGRGQALVGGEAGRGQARVWGPRVVRRGAGRGPGAGRGRARLWSRALVGAMRGLGPAQVWTARVWGDAGRGPGAGLGNRRGSGEAQVGDQAVGAARGSGAGRWSGRRGSGAGRGSGARRGSGTARVGGEARVWGQARVGGQAQVGDDALVGSTRHVVTVGPVGSEYRHVTVWRHQDGTARITAGCWTGTPGELAVRIAPGGGHDWPKATEGRWRADYEAVIALARARQAEWVAELSVVG